MAHARTTNQAARIIDQCARGRRFRYTAQKPVIFAVDRATIDTDSHVLATVIDGETLQVPLFVAPCDGKVLRCFANALQYPSTTGAATVNFYKAVIGAADVQLVSSTISVDNPTDETAIDATLSTTAGALDLIEGQLVYAQLALTAVTSERSDAMVVGVEWMPTDKSV